jgi:hypothetical protein
MSDQNDVKPTFPEAAARDGVYLVKIYIGVWVIRFTKQALDLSPRFTDKKLAVDEVLPSNREWSGPRPSIRQNQIFLGACRRNPKQLLAEVPARRHAVLLVG